LTHSWQQDKGFRAAKSRNKAIVKSNGDYIILIDGDMILHPQFIEDHISNAEPGYFVQGTRALLTQSTTQNVLAKMRTNFSFLSSGIQNRKNTIHSIFLSRLFSKKKNYLRGIKTCNMAFFKQDCINVNGFNNSFEGWGREDSEFVVRLLNNGINRKNLRFNAIQFHLWHNENTRTSLKQNDILLQDAIDNDLQWCDNGINRYL
jgi:glycosyltransferase involved in cell wall biosynthesis